jgi:hypothetical protein
MRLPAFFAALAFGLTCAAEAGAETVGQALASGDSGRAAAALTASLADALSRSQPRLQAAQVEALRAGLARDLAPIASLSRRRPRVDVEIVWRGSAAPQRRGACGGLVDVGEARVVATSTSRSLRAGTSSFSCSLMTQDEDEHGWTGVWLLTAGQGALFTRMSASSEDPAVRNAASQSLQRALQRIARAVQPASAARPPQRTRPRQPQPPRPPRQPPPPPLDETI